jgi:glycosyltransferase involved in cell wall biosynthesis
MDLPPLSVIVPNYNHAQHLPTCLKAILAQSVTPVEVIVLDDASTDNSVEIVRQFASHHPQLRLVQNEKNLGVMPNVNKGVDLARSEYVFIQAADDEVQPGLFEKSLRLLVQYPQAGLCCTIADWREAATGLHWHVGVGMAETPSYLSPQRLVELERKRQLFISSNTCVLKRSVLLETGKFIPDLKSSADWFSCSLIGFRYGICFVPEPLAVLNILPNSYYQRIRRDKQSLRQMLEAILRFLSRPEYQDVAERMRQAGSLYLFGIPMLKLLLSRPESRHFLTPVLLRNSLWHGTKLFLKKFIPTPLGNLYFQIAGYRTRTPAVI